MPRLFVVDCRVFIYYVAKINNIIKTVIIIQMTVKLIQMSQDHPIRFPILNQNQINIHLIKEVSNIRIRKNKIIIILKVRILIMNHENMILIGIKTLN